MTPRVRLSLSVVAEVRWLDCFAACLAHRFDVKLGAALVPHRVHGGRIRMELALPPLPQGKEDREQLLSDLGEEVLVADWALAVGLSTKDADGL